MLDDGPGDVWGPGQHQDFDTTFFAFYRQDVVLVLRSADRAILKPPRQT